MENRMWFSDFCMTDVTVRSGIFLLYLTKLHYFNFCKQAAI